MTTVDWVALGFVAFVALLGLWRGLLASGLSLAGVAVGAVLGARLAPHVLPDGSLSTYTPVVALLGAAVLALLFEAIGSALGGAIRARLGPLRLVDTVGGLVLGAGAGLALVWVAGAVALNLPRPDVRREVQRSEVLRRLNDVVPPRRALDLLVRFDPFPSISGPPVPTDPPDPSVLRRPGVRAALPSVVRIVGTACGLGVAGSGWVASPGVVITNAHVVAGQRDTRVDPPGPVESLRAVALAFDARNDVAVLRVEGLSAGALRLADADSGDPVAILGYPENGPLDAEPGRIGRTQTVLTEDAYGRGPVARAVTSVRGEVRRGNSGGPAVTAAGGVATTIFAARRGNGGGYGVPNELVRRALASARQPVSTGPCTR